MIFSGHSRSLHLLRSSSDESLATSHAPEARGSARNHNSPKENTTSSADNTTPWFTPKPSGKEASKAEPWKRTEWPNGLPPSGPRSQRVAISPPAVRQFSNEYENTRRMSDNGTATSFTRQSFPSSVQWRRTDTFPASSRGVDHAIELREVEMFVATGDTEKAAAQPKFVDPSNSSTSPHRTSDDDQQATVRLSKEAEWTGESGNGQSPILERASSEHADDFLMCLDATETPYAERFPNVNSSHHPSPPLPRPQNGHPEDTASVVSDLTMSSGAAVSGPSSTTSSSRRRTCHKCKKAAQAASLLFKCTQCPRRYHRHCAVPKVPASSQTSSVLGWVCKHCVENFRERDVPGIAHLQSSLRDLTDRTDLRSDSSPIIQRELNSTMAAFSTRYRRLNDWNTAATQERISAVEEDGGGVLNVPADSGFHQAVWNASNQQGLSNVDQPHQMIESPTDVDACIYEARAIKQESMGGFISNNMPDHFNPPPRHESTEHCRSNFDNRRHSTDLSRKASRANLSEIPSKAVTVDNPASWKPAVANSFAQNHVPKLPSSRYFDPFPPKRDLVSQVDSDCDEIEEGEATISAENSPEIGRSISDTTATTGRLQRLPETVSFKNESQPFKKSLKYLTCYHWKQRGGCRYSEEDCQYSHYDTGLDEGKNTTCFWWWNTGHCKKSEKECLYAHRDTGLYAKPPPGYVPQNGKYTAPRSPDKFPRNSWADHYSPPLSPRLTHSLTNGLAPEHPPALPELTAVSSRLPVSSSDRPAVSNVDGFPSKRAEPKVFGADPRLSRHPSSVSLQGPVEKSETFLAASKPGLSNTSISPTIEPTTPVPGPTNVIEPSSSFKKCGKCDKKVFGSASLCFGCKGTKSTMSLDVVKSFPFVPETPELDTEMTPEVQHQPASDVVPPTSPENPIRQSVNPLKRTISASGPASSDNLFFKNRKRVFKSSDPRRPSIEMSPLEVSSQSPRDIPVVLSRLNGAVGGMIARTPIHLEELIELEKLRKQVAFLKKSNSEEKDALHEARKLCAEEKNRADNLSEEIQSLKVRDQDSRNLSHDEQKRTTAPLTPSRKRQYNDGQGDVTRTPQVARRSKNGPNHTRRQSLNDYDKSSEASLQSPRLLRDVRIEIDKKRLLRDMAAIGRILESDDDSDDGPEVPPPTPFKPPRDPLWRPSKSSRDLFEIAPQYQQENLSFDLETRKKEIAARPSRKKTFGRVLALSGREWGTANAHREVDRRLPSRIVRVSVPDISEEVDPLQDVGQMKEIEVEMSFEEFLGVPENAQLCTTTNGQLAYRDSALDQWGKLRRVPDDEKFEIGTKGT